MTSVNMICHCGLLYEALQADNGLLKIALDGKVDLLKSCEIALEKAHAESAAQAKRIEELELSNTLHELSRGTTKEEMIKEIEVLRKQVEILKQTSPTSNGFCGRSGGCVCGGDLPRVRESCSNWVKSTQKGIE